MPRRRAQLLALSPISSDIFVRCLTVLYFAGYCYNMANTVARHRAIAVLVAFFVGLGALTACGGAPATPVVYCAGPEVPDDIEDLFDRDMVRYPDEVCAQGALPRGFALVSAPSYADVPDFGEELDSDSDWGYHRSHRRGHSPAVVYVEKPAKAPRVSVLVVREPTVGSAAVRASASSVAAQARKTAGPATTPPLPSGSPTVQRGGLGTGAADKQDSANAARLKREADAASKAAAAGRAKASAGKATTSKSTRSKTG